ncbi:MAG: hypothetical protein ACQETE_06040 [Bacteroidota bacterium]
MGGGGGGAVGLRLNIMTALYLPILGYAMATFDLDADALVLNSNNLKPNVVAENQRVAVGDQYEASIMFTLENPEHTSGDGHGSAIFVPKIELDYSETPESMQWDEAEERLVMNTNQLFENEGSDVYTKEVAFAGTITGKTAKDIQQDRPPSYVEEISGKFTVFRPTIQVQSNAVPKLYSNSRNSLAFTVPGVDASTLSLREKFSGQSFSGNSLTFAPDGDTTAIEVFRSTGDGENSKLGEKGFKITTPPTPTVGLRQKGDQEFFNAESRVDLFSPFEIVVRADQTFASEYPDDAKYRVDEMKVEVTRTGLAPLSETFSQSQLRDRLDLKNAGEGEFIYEVDLFDVSNNPTGSGISVFITGLSRMNYQNQRIPINLENVPSQFTYKSQ